MTHDEFYLLKLAEECAEVQHRIFKLLQFGPTDIEPGLPGIASNTNAARLKFEVDDLLAVLQILDGRNQLLASSFTTLAAHTKTKREKIFKFLKLSEDMGYVVK